MHYGFFYFEFPLVPSVEWTGVVLWDWFVSRNSSLSIGIWSCFNPINCVVISLNHHLKMEVRFIVEVICQFPFLRSLSDQKVASKYDFNRNADFRYKFYWGCEKFKSEDFSLEIRFMIGASLSRLKMFKSLPMGRGLVVKEICDNCGECRFTRAMTCFCLYFFYPEFQKSFQNCLMPKLYIWSNCEDWVVVPRHLPSFRAVVWQ